MPLTTFETGSTIKIDVTFTDPVDGVTLVDPINVTLTVRKPDKSVLGPFTYGVGSEITKVSVGKYRYRITLSNDGSYAWKWTGTSGTTIGTVVRGSLLASSEIDL